MDYQTKMKIRRWVRQPFITYTLLAVQTVLFILMTLDGGSTNTDTLIRYGAKVNPLIIIGDWWRLVTPMFLHIGFTHILMNSIVLYFLGIQLESIYGPWRFLGIYLLSGIAGNAASFAFSQSVSAGASTALFGLFGAAVILGKLYPGNYAIQSMAKRFSTLILLNLVFGMFSAGIDFAGHVGGLIGGAILSYVFAPAGTYRLARKDRIRYGVFFTGFILILVGIGYGKFFLLYR